MNKLIENIKGIQTEKGMTDSELSSYLGIDRTTWSAIKRGKRKPGIKFLKGVARQFPELIPLVSAELSPIEIKAHHPSPVIKMGWLYRLLDKLLRKIAKRLIIEPDIRED